MSVVARDYFYESPTTASSGLVPVRLDNQGKEPHQAQLVRLKDGRTLRDLAAAAQDPTRAALFEVADLAGGPNVVAPGKSDVTVQTLDPGSYGILCFVHAADGETHVAKGMLGGFTVAAPATGNAPPSTERDVSLDEFGIDIPETLSAGSHSIGVTNSGSVTHEFGLARLLPGKTLADASASVKGTAGGAPPWSSVGGIGGLPPGSAGFVRLDSLEPGDYVAMCLMVDPTTGRYHAALGMITAVTVH